MRSICKTLTISIGFFNYSIYIYINIINKRKHNEHKIKNINLKAAISLHLTPTFVAPERVFKSFSL